MENEKVDKTISNICNFINDVLNRKRNITQEDESLSSIIAALAELISARAK